MTERRPTRRPLHNCQTDYVALFLRECASIPGRDVRRTVRIKLSFFSPRDERLRTLEALEVLAAEFAGELPSWARIYRDIDRLRRGDA